MRKLIGTEISGQGRGADDAGVFAQGGEDDFDGFLFDGPDEFVEVVADAIEQDIVKRDARDIGRKDAPLRAAQDALIFDTTEFDKDQSITEAIAAVEARLAK